MITIPLTRGYFAVVDDCDSAIASHKWYALVTKTGLVYAARRTLKKLGPRRVVLMHRDILGLTATAERGDHINGDTLDNRRANLRAVTHTENLRNLSGARRNSRSGFLGIQPSRHRAGDFMVFLTINGRNTYLGTYPSLDAARAARVEAERKHWGVQPRRAAEHSLFS